MRSLIIITVTLLLLMECSEGHRNHQRRNLRTRRSDCPDPPCAKDCPFGYIHDDATGYTLCECEALDPPGVDYKDCPMIECDMDCPNGFGKDEKGCPWCRCLPLAQGGSVNA